MYWPGTGILLEECTPPYPIPTYMSNCHVIMTYDELSYVNLSYDTVTLGTMTH